MTMLRLIFCAVVGFVVAFDSDNNFAHATSQIPRILHQIAGKGESLDTRVMAAEIRAAHEQLGWQVHAWKESELLDRYGRDRIVGQVTANRNWRNVYADVVRRRLSVLVLRDHGGVYVRGDKELVAGKSFDDVLNRLQPSATFFVGMNHPGESARMVLDECNEHSKLSDKIKECGKYIPINVGVMGSTKDSRAIVEATGAWYHTTSPAEEIGSVSDGNLVLLNWKFFSADKAVTSQRLVGL